jgi:hypothetical protein
MCSTSFTLSRYRHRPLQICIKYFAASRAGRLPNQTGAARFRSICWRKVAFFYFPNAIVWSGCGGFQKPVMYYREKTWSSCPPTTRRRPSPRPWTKSSSRTLWMRSSSWTTAAATRRCRSPRPCSAYGFMSTKKTPATAATKKPATGSRLKPALTSSLWSTRIINTHPS